MGGSAAAEMPISKRGMRKLPVIRRQFERRSGLTGVREPLGQTEHSTYLWPIDWSPKFQRGFRAEILDPNTDFPILLHHLEKPVQSNCENCRAKGLVVRPHSRTVSAPVCPGAPECHEWPGPASGYFKISCRTGCRRSLRRIQSPNGQSICRADRIVALSQRPANPLGLLRRPRHLILRQEVRPNAGRFQLDSRIDPELAVGANPPCASHSLGMLDKLVSVPILMGSHG